jgi:predicted RNA binding protein YcfA (HicA-like mRNA interferase family)
MPRLKVLSGAEVVRILSIFGFKVASQRGSHIKLRRIEAGGGQQTLTIPNHNQIHR